MQKKPIHGEETVLREEARFQYAGHEPEVLVINVLHVGFGWADIEILEKHIPGDGELLLLKSCENFLIGDAENLGHVIVCL